VEVKMGLLGKTLDEGHVLLTEYAQYPAAVRPADLKLGEALPFKLLKRFLALEPGDYYVRRVRNERGEW
jgi:hypothetical protein